MYEMSVTVLASTVCCDVYCQQCSIFVRFNKSYLKCRFYVLVTTEPAMYYIFGMFYIHLSYVALLLLTHMNIYTLI